MTRTVTTTLCLLTLGATLTFAGVGKGRISGFITDPQGTPIPDATLTFRHMKQGFELEVSTNDKGKYVISTLPYGPIQVTITAEGYGELKDNFDFVPQMSPMKKDIKLGAPGGGQAGEGGQQVIEGLTKELATALDDANAAKLGDDWPEVVRLLSTVRADSGDHPLLLMGLVEAHMKLNQTAEATDVLHAALKLEPVPSGTHFYLGNIAAGAGDKAKAMEHFEAETQLSPDNDRAFFNYGAMAYETGDVDTAITALEKAHEINADNADAANLLSQLYAETGRTDEAQSIAKSGGGDPTAILNVAIKNYTDHKDKEALEGFKQVIAIDPSLARAHKLMGLTYVRLGDLEGAKSALRKAVELDPKDDEAATMLRELGG